MMRITTEEVMSCAPCANYPRSRVGQLCGEGVTATHALGLDIPVEDKRWLLTNILVRRDPKALIAWVWRCLARVDRDCPHWRAMLAAPGDVALARAANDAANAAYGAYAAYGASYAVDRAAARAAAIAASYAAAVAANASRAGYAAYAAYAASAASADDAPNTSLLLDLAQTIDTRRSP